MAKKKSATKKVLLLVGSLTGLLVLVLIVGSATGAFGSRDRSSSVEVSGVDVRDITQVVTASGRIQPEQEVKISPDVSGEIIELRVREGHTVRQGELLARIRPDFYVSQVEQADAGVSQARASLAQRRADLMKAELDLKRQEELFTRNAISESEVLAARTTFEVAKSALESADFGVQSAEARLREARENLGKTSIFSPMTGTVSRLNVELGERVVGTSQMAGTEMMTIARLEQMELEVDVNENDVVNVSVGDTARVMVDAYPSRRFRGVVTEIANSARVSGQGTQEQVTNFPVKIRILEAHNLTDAGSSATAEAPSFRPGMSGRVDIFTRTVHEAVVVPIQAVTVRDINRVRRADDQGARALGTLADASAREDLRRVVFVVIDGKAEMFEVETGIADDTHIQIVSGLDGGEEVVTGPFRVVSRELAPGTGVRTSAPKAARSAASAE
jgi:HlyD family secretion protein